MCVWCHCYEKDTILDIIKWWLAFHISIHECHQLVLWPIYYHSFKCYRFQDAVSFYTGSMSEASVVWQKALMPWPCCHKWGPALWIRATVPEYNICWACAWLFLGVRWHDSRCGCQKFFLKLLKDHKKMIITPLKPLSKCSWSPWNDGMAVQSCVGLSPKSGKRNAGVSEPTELGRPTLASSPRCSSFSVLFCF